MSPIGKIFIAVNLVLAAAFLGWAAYASSSNAEYKTKFEKETIDHKATKTQLESDLAKVSAEKNEWTNKATMLQGQKEESLRDSARYKEELDKEKAGNGELRASVTKIEARLDGLVSSNEKLQADKAKAVAAQVDAEKARDKSLAEKLDAEKNANKLDGELRTARNGIADLEKAKTSLEKELQSRDNELASLVAATGVDRKSVAAMPLIEGRVLAVSMDVEPGLVSINKGEADGVKPGYTFELFDGKTYKGQARVQWVHPNMCSAVMLRAVGGQKIRQGDGASTRLN